MELVRPIPARFCTYKAMNRQLRSGQYGRDSSAQRGTLVGKCRDAEQNGNGSQMIAPWSPVRRPPWQKSQTRGLRESVAVEEVAEDIRNTNNGGGRDNEGKSGGENEERPERDELPCCEASKKPCMVHEPPCGGGVKPFARLRAVAKKNVVALVRSDGTTRRPPVGS